MSTLDQFHEKTKFCDPRRIGVVLGQRRIFCSRTVTGIARIDCKAVDKKHDGKALAKDRAARPQHIDVRAEEREQHRSRLVYLRGNIQTNGGLEGKSTPSLGGC